MGELVAFKVNFEVIDACAACGVSFAAPAHLIQARRNDNQRFYCPNGHINVYRTNELDKLRAENKRLQEAKQQADLAVFAARKLRDNAQLEARMTRGKLNAIKQRVKNGVCPCCHRSFVQLARHMATKHPEYTHKEPEHQPGDQDKPA